MVGYSPKPEAAAEDRLTAIADEISGCRKCPLANGRTNTVPGEGSASAEIMFIGEGPGRDEDLSGRPFVGRAGKLLDELIASLPMRREDVYIANVVKCRPPGNRDPQREEAEQCSGYLKRQIDVVDPLVIVPLGRHALEWFQPQLRITASNGRIFRHGNRVLMPLLHPSAGLRGSENARMLREGIHNLRDALLEGIRVRREIDAAASNSEDRSIAQGSIESTEARSQPTVSDADEPAVPVAASSDRQDVSAGIFARSQTEEEVRTEMHRQRAAEAAEAAAAEDNPPVMVDERQSSFF